MLNKDLIKGPWKIVSGKIKRKWGKLTDDDLMKIAGSYENLIGLLQTVYGYTKYKASKEVAAFKKVLKKDLKILKDKIKYKR